VLAAGGQRIRVDPFDQRQRWRLGWRAGEKLLDRGWLALGLDNHATGVVAHETTEPQAVASP
jgi:hypothetical protein